MNDQLNFLKPLEAESREKQDSRGPIVSVCASEEKEETSVREKNLTVTEKKKSYCVRKKSDCKWN